MYQHVPEGWKISTLGSLTNIIAGGTPSTRVANYWNGDVLWMSSGELNLRRVITTSGRITELGLRNSSARLLPKNCVLIGLAGQGKTRGTVAINLVELSTNQSIAAILPSLFFDSEFLFFHLDARYKELRRLSTGDGGRGALNLKLLKSINVILPPLPEQRAIAKVLGLMDEAISNVRKTIEQKKLQKKYLMQTLLTGKKRLKGFTDEWQTLHISDVAREVSRKNKGNESLTVLSCTKHDGLVPSLEYFGRQIFSRDLSTYKVVPKNHFAYATNHIEEGSIGYQGKYDRALISPMYTVFKTDEQIDDRFFFSLLKSHYCIHQFGARMEGTIDRRGGLRWDAFSVIKIRIPDHAEQKAIANILEIADWEIALLNTKAEFLQLQKKWLMQVLLTGKRRLRS